MVLAPPKIRYLHHDSPSSDEGFELKSIARTDNTTLNSLAIAAMNLVCADAQSVMNGDNSKLIERSSLAGFCIWISTIRSLYHWKRCHQPVGLQKTFHFTTPPAAGTGQPVRETRCILLLTQPTNASRPCTCLGYGAVAFAVIESAIRKFTCPCHHHLMLKPMDSDDFQSIPIV